VRAAFCGRSVGFGRVTLGAGGGRAAVCGDAASGLKGVLEVGMMTGGESCRGGTVLVAVALRDDQADIIARRRHECNKSIDVLGIKWEGWTRARVEAIVVVEVVASLLCPIRPIPIVVFGRVTVSTDYLFRREGDNP
jgi:hypothetical protein